MQISKKKVFCRILNRLYCVGVACLNFRGKTFSGDSQITKLLSEALLYNIQV